MAPNATETTSLVNKGNNDDEENLRRLKGYQWCVEFGY
jgi:hypothetical protein